MTGEEARGKVLAYFALRHRPAPPRIARSRCRPNRERWCGLHLIAFRSFLCGSRPSQIESVEKLYMKTGCTDQRPRSAEIPFHGATLSALYRFAPGILRRGIGLGEKARSALYTGRAQSAGL
jgi:hypothetical protein